MTSLAAPKAALIQRVDTLEPRGAHRPD
ncbi:hypothetical protein OIHEL45_19716 [Sulfitobacter indolifex HEL-45]|uniref:Uncharacterized protein n=1 Tax=Sulfitobacter indolifex HEL-45 TaxID=391624 RepID=A0ABM9X0L0_9RHOB|nr:hypothetical protein OIHEL45_19716 [Sulfitobacter indolifex HEL-45]